MMERIPMHTGNNTGPTVEEIDVLIRRLPTFKPLAKFLQSLGVDPKSADARRLAACAIVRIAMDAKKLPRPKPTKSTKWTEAHDVELRLEVSRLRCVEGISERASIRKLSATWPFPYSPHAGRRSSKSDPKKQREEALLARWNSLKRREKSWQAEAAQYGAAGVWAFALAVPIGEIRRAFGHSTFTRSNQYAESNVVNT
jgi:hypothetical protein